MRAILTVGTIASVLVVANLPPANARDRGITNTASSPHVRLKSVDLDDVKWTTGFWAERFELCRTATLSSLYRALLDPRNAARLSRLRVAARLQKEGRKGVDWADGDCYKWIETMAYVFAVTQDPKLDQLMDEWIEVISKAQDPDGYISTNIGHDQRARWQIPHRHEIYNMGHLLTAACIHHRATGKDNFLRVARKLADYLYTEFQPRPPRLIHFGWNPSNIMGLIEMYRTTADRRYLQLAQIFVDNRGTAPGGDSHKGGTDQIQDRVPLRQETHAVGHAVTAMYLYCGATDIYGETGENQLLESLERIWIDVTTRKMDITGAVGYGNVISARGDRCHEAFGAKYQLPNQYNETCSNIANGMWNWRLLSLNGQAKYADLMETVAYNSLTAAVDLAGEKFFYCNPLVWRAESDRGHRTGARWFVHSCYCCPPSVGRTIAKLHGWAYSVSDAGVWINLYGGNRLQTELSDGTPVALRQETNYPWQGHVKITVERTPAMPWSVMLRIPGWAKEADVKVNGHSIDTPPVPGSYLTVSREWSVGDVIELDLPMEVRLMQAHPAVENLRNHVAIMRGPIAYCLELPKQGDGDRLWQEGIFLPENVVLAPRATDDFGGAVLLDAQALTSSGKDHFVHTNAAADPTLVQSDWAGILYQPMQPRHLPPPTEGTVNVTLIPYYAWANRGPSYMEVWIPLAR